MLSGSLSWLRIGSRSGLLFLFALLVLSAAPEAARAEEKESGDLRAVIEAELADLSRFRLPCDSSQVGPHGPVQPKDEPSKLYRALGWATYGVSAGDVISTEVLLARGGTEVNPFQRNRAFRIGSHIATPFVMNGLSEYVRKKGRPKAALWMRIATVTFFGYLTARNIHIARGLEP